MELLRQGQQGLGQQSHFLGPDGDFAPLGAEYHAVYAHNVANIILLEGLIGLLAHLVPADIELNSALSILKIAEGNLAHDALGHQAARNFHRLFFHGLKAVTDFLGVVLLFKFRNLEGILACLLQCSELVPADLQQFPQILGVIHIFRHRSPSVQRVIFKTL